MKNNGLKRINRIIGERIAFFRRECGYTQAEVAVRLGCSQNTISLIENGKVEITVTFIYRFCRLAHILPSEIIDDAFRKPNYQLEVKRLMDKMSRKELEKLLKIIHFFI